MFTTSFLIAHLQWGVEGRTNMVKKKIKLKKFKQKPVISGQKAPLGRILRNFRLHLRTPEGTPKESRDPLVTFGSNCTSTTVLHFVLTSCSTTTSNATLSVLIYY